MNRRINLKERWQGLTDTVMRFPMTIILLIAAVVTNAISIVSEYDINYTRLLVTFLLGAAVFVVLQLFYERFLDNPIFRIIFMLVTVAASSVYYLLIRRSEWEVVVTIRTIAICFVLLIAFLWIPTIRSHISINESFMAAFKSSFIALFFDGVLFLGVVLIIRATDLLIFSVNDEAYVHAANFIFILLTPIYFLSMIPFYPRKQELLKDPEGKRFSHLSQSENQLPVEELIADSGMGDDNLRMDEFRKITTPGKLLETLISYVIIPITAIFTIILLLYIIMNITGKFWSDNLMEPMLVSYSITVILVYILASTLQNPFANKFRLIFPKVLIPVVLFQTLSSCLKISDIGVTYGRYYVILFGVFATIAGIIFSILPTRKNGIIAPILIILSTISIIPPVDAFTLSRITQTERLRNTLIKNEMLSDTSIIPNNNLDEKEKADIISSLDYLDRMDYTKSIHYLQPYYTSGDFEKTFGFDRYNNASQEYQSFYVSRDTGEPIPVAGYDYMLQISIYNMAELKANSFAVNGSNYHLRVDNADKNNQSILIEDEQGQELLRFDYNQMFSGFVGKGNKNEPISTSELTFRSENDKASMTVIANNLSQSEWEQGEDKSADLIILVDIK